LLRDDRRESTGLVDEGVRVEDAASRAEGRRADGDRELELGAALLEEPDRRLDPFPNRFSRDLAMKARDGELGERADGGAFGVREIHRTQDGLDVLPRRPAHGDLRDRDALHGEARSFPGDAALPGRGARSPVPRIAWCRL
jgi:hypothetical protein